MSQKIAYILVFLCGTIFSQENKEASFFVDANYFYGSILRHNKDISHLIKNHPEGLILSYNRKTFGSKRWEQAYNYPDWGFSFLYQNPHNPILGENYGIHGHYNFYFLRRNLLLRLGTGITYNTNPFDLDTNFKNNAYGSHFMNSTYLMLNYTKQNLFYGFGLQAGIAMVHYSNANLKAPNSSTNTFAINLGVNYNFDAENTTEYIITKNFKKFSKQIRFNLMLRGGVNESDFIGLGQQPFGAVSVYASKRLSFLSSIQLGTDVFFSKFLQKEVEYIAAAFPNRGITGDEDYKRAGLFAGHELHINKLAFVTQFGYYVYQKYDFEGRTYLRAGLNYYLSDRIFAGVTLKSHGAKAEAIEFGLGIRI